MRVAGPDAERDVGRQLGEHHQHVGAEVEVRVIEVDASVQPDRDLRRARRWQREH
jgi:hypothetical protein